MFHLSFCGSTGQDRAAEDGLDIMDDPQIFGVQADQLAQLGGTVDDSPLTWINRGVVAGEDHRFIEDFRKHFDHSLCARERRERHPEDFGGDQRSLLRFGFPGHRRNDRRTAGSQDFEEFYLAPPQLVEQISRDGVLRSVANSISVRLQDDSEFPD